MKRRTKKKTYAWYCEAIEALVGSFARAHGGQAALSALYPQVAMLHSLLKPDERTTQ